LWEQEILKTQNAWQYIWDVLKDVLRDILGTTFGISYFGFPCCFR
jgi:hypothetical protein